MRRPTVLHTLAASGLALVVAVPVAATTGVLPAVAAPAPAAPPPPPTSPEAWTAAAQAAQDGPADDEAALALRTANAVRAHASRQRARGVVAQVEAEKAAAAQAEADRIAAEQAAAARAEAERVAAELAARQAEAERASRAARAARDPRSIARELLGDGEQFGCLDRLWTKESGWKTTADNPSSSAYGIPQALPGSKMASAGGDWRTNPETQIRWGLGYIEDSYGSPCAAWRHSQANNWY